MELILRSAEAIDQTVIYKLIVIPIIEGINVVQELSLCAV